MYVCVCVCICVCVLCMYVCYVCVYILQYAYVYPDTLIVHGIPKARDRHDGMLSLSVFKIGGNVVCVENRLAMPASLSQCVPVSLHITSDRASRL
jgi:hypothetical protein